MADIAKSAGISRQALYLHFPARAELLIATTRHIDEKKNIEARLASSRNAETGIDRLNAYIEAWGNYIPEIHGVARALMALQDSDAAAKLAWEDRMHAVREGCEAAIKALRNDGGPVFRLHNQQSHRHSLGHAVGWPMGTAYRHLWLVTVPVHQADKGHRLPNTAKSTNLPDVAELNSGDPIRPVATFGSCGYIGWHMSESFRIWNNHRVPTSPTGDAFKWQT